LASDFDGWQPIGDELGHGGQGVVYAARSPERARLRDELEERVRGALHQISSGHYSPLAVAEWLTVLGSPDPPEHLGALKVFQIPAGADEAQAVGRLTMEVNALSKLKGNPAILKLLHYNVVKRILVTEYHPGGTLDKNLGIYKGRTHTALQAFRPLVDAVVAIHKEGAIHRDIKPENIFVAHDGCLVLGDFGIVIYKDGHRLTTTFERVGSHFWMAPWAYKNERLEIEDINPTLDIYPLARVLWSMIAGRNGFSYWEYDRPEITSNGYFQMIQ
jgi:serine/threonine protein kinase